MKIENHSQAQRAFDKDLDAFARAIIDRDPQKLLRQAQILIDQAARLIAIQHDHVPANALNALVEASRAAAVYEFSRTIREIQRALDVANRHTNET